MSTLWGLTDTGGTRGLVAWRHLPQRGRVVALVVVAAVMGGPSALAVGFVRSDGSPAAFAQPVRLVAATARGPVRAVGVVPSRGSDAGAKAGLVDIYTRAPGVAGAGTGIVLSSTGEVVTNNHVVAGADTIEAKDLATGRSYPAVVLGADAHHDVAVVQLQGGASGLPVAPIADSDELEVGMAIRAIGNLGGRGGAPTVTAGTITGLDQCVTAHDTYRGEAERLCGLIRASVIVRPGDSGGPMVSDAGVIGMDVAADTENGFAIPINTVLAVARKLASSDGLTGRGPEVADPLAVRGTWGRGLSSGPHGGL
jgi:S1-C subfamily serine protease